MRKQRILFMLALLALVSSLSLTALLTSHAHAAASETTIVTKAPLQPTPYIVFDPCTGEQVQLSGDVLGVFHETTDATGTIHVRGHSDYQSVSGVGLVSGIQYQAQDAGTTGFNFDIIPGYPQNDTFADDFLLISQGSVPNSLVHTLFHVTVNANGDITAFMDNMTVECQ